MTPSEILNAAADRIRDLAAAATDNVCPEWTRRAVRHIARNGDIDCGHVHGDGWDHDGWGRYGDAPWVAALSPAVAEPLAGAFDLAAQEARSMAEDGREVNPNWAMLRLAEAILGSGEDTP